MCVFFLFPTILAVSVLFLKATLSKTLWRVNPVSIYNPPPLYGAVSSHRAQSVADKISAQMQEQLRHQGAGAWLLCCGCGGGVVYAHHDVYAGCADAITA